MLSLAPQSVIGQVKLKLANIRPDLYYGRTFDRTKLLPQSIILQINMQTIYYIAVVSLPAIFVKHAQCVLDSV